jgi:hypothetical protein
LLDIKANSLTFIERLESGPLNSAVMDKHVAALITLDKAKPLLFIEPFYLTFCQSFLPSFRDFSPSGITKHPK